MCLPNLKFLVSTFHEIWKGSENFKIRSHEPFPTPFDLIVHFSYSAACTESVYEIWGEYLYWWPVFYYFCRFGCEMPIPARSFAGGFLGVWPLNVVAYCREPQKAHPWPETRVLTYRLCRSVTVKKCDLKRWRKQKKKKKKEKKLRDVTSHIFAQTTDVALSPP